MELDFDKVADSLELMAKDLMKVYTSSVTEAVLVAGVACWLRELATALRSASGPIPLRRYEPSVN